MSLENQTRLVELTGRARETITRLLKPLASTTKGREKLYESRDALPLIYEIETGGQSRYDLVQERAHLAHSQRIGQDLRNNILRADVMPTPLVVQSMNDQVTACKTKLLGIPAKVRSRCPGVSQAVLDEIEQQIIESLEELGGRSIPKGLRDVLEEHLRSLASATEPDAKPVGG